MNRWIKHVIIDDRNHPCIAMLHEFRRPMVAEAVSPRRSMDHPAAEGSTDSTGFSNGTV